MLSLPSECLFRTASKTSYDAVAAIEAAYTNLTMRNIIGKDGSSIFVPYNEETYRILEALATGQAPPWKIVMLTRPKKINKGVVMGYPLRMPVELLIRQHGVKEASH